MLTDPTYLSLFIIALSAGLFLLVYFQRQPFALFILALFAYVSEALLGTGALNIGLGSFSVSMMDMLAFFMIVLAGARLIFYRGWARLTILLVSIIFVLLLISWLRGIELFGIQRSTNAFRAYFYFFAVLLFTISLRYSADFFRRFVLWLSACGWALIAIALVRWVFVALGLASSINWTSASGFMTRVLNATNALFLLQVLILNGYTRCESRKIFLSRFLPYIFIPAILILQHRSVWGALFFVAILILFLERRIGGIFAVGLLILAGLAVLIFDGFTLSANTLAGTFLDLGSFNWRLQNWLLLLDPKRFLSTLDLFIGQPFGTDYVRYAAGAEYAITFSAHNLYLQTFLNVGGLGLAFVLVLYGYATLKLWRLRRSKISRGFIALLAVQLVYGIAYSMSYEQGLILGLALLFIAGQNQVETI